MTAELIATAIRWRDQDPDDETRAELDSLISAARAGSAAATSDLNDRFARRLDFGTAGLRGSLGAGPNRMNRVLVAQAAAGLAAYLRSRGENPTAVIGFDGRKNSLIFAIDSAEILSGAGITTTLLPRPLPTPLLAFAVRHLDASAGVMVTASHNPATDNGYKVYLGDDDAGSQIVPPADGHIAARILEAAALDIRALPRSTDYRIAGEDVLDAYVVATAAIGNAAAQPRVVYTPLHGVGWESARRVFASAGFDEPATVTEQLTPDGTFPTVAFPNPEEDGTLDLAFGLAKKIGAELVISNDPDADRLAIGIPEANGWRRLSGNEVGLLLGWRAAERVPSGTLASSIVSSPGLSAIAAEYGLAHIETLTGFKWISRVPNLVFGFEEALGYLVDPEVVRDKDGLSAAIDFLSLAAELAARGSTVAEHLDEFTARFGAFASAQVSLRFAELSQIPLAMTRLRARPPVTVGGVAVTAVDDFAPGFGAFPPSNVLRMWTTDGSRIIIRPSGTEPKLKIYVDAQSDVGSVEERRRTARSAVETLELGMRQLLALA